MLAHRLSLWLPVVIWAGLIFAFSSIPSLGTGLGTWDLVLRKIAHAAEFAILTLLLWRALRRERLVFVLASGYAATDELHQSFVEGRVGSVADWAIDTAGVIFALAGVRLWRRHQRDDVPDNGSPALDDAPGETP